MGGEIERAAVVQLILVLAAGGAGGALFWFERDRAPLRLEYPERASAHAFRAAGRFGLPALALGLAYLCSEIPLLFIAAWPAYWLMLMLIFLACLGTAIMLIPLGLYAAVRKSAQEGAVRFVLGICLIGTTSVLVHSRVIAIVDWRVREYCEKAEPVARAIEAYERGKGCPPDSLQQLIPRYLEAVPKNDGGRFAPLAYESIPASDTLLTMVRYALRPERKGEYAFDTPVIWAKADALGRLVAFEIQHDQGGAGAEAFVRQAWRDSIAARWRMAKSLPAMFPMGTRLEDVIAQLGPPDDRWTRRQPRWQLRSEFDAGFGGDALMRTSNDEPPSAPYDDASPERIGRWWRLDRGD